MSEDEIQAAVRDGETFVLADEVRRLQAALHKAYRDSQSDTQKAYLQGLTEMRDKAIEAIRGMLPPN